MARRKPSDTFHEGMDSWWGMWMAPKLADRLQLLLPCPYKVMDLYRFGWTPEQAAALKVLAPVGGLLRGAHHVVVEMPLPGEDGKIRHNRLQLNLERSPRWPDGLPVGNRSSGRNTNLLGRDDLPPDVYEVLCRWTQKAQWMQAQHKLMTQDFKAAVRSCSNMAQVLKLWPELGPFYRERNKAPKQKAAPPRFGRPSDLKPHVWGEILATLHLLPDAGFRYFELS